MSSRSNRDLSEGMEYLRDLRNLDKPGSKSPVKLNDQMEISNADIEMIRETLAENSDEELVQINEVSPNFHTDKLHLVNSAEISRSDKKEGSNDI